MKQSIKAVDIISPEEPPNFPSFPSLPDLEVHGLDTGGEAVSGGSMGSEPAGVGLGVEPGVGGVGLCVGGGIMPDGVGLRVGRRVVLGGGSGVCCCIALHCEVEKEMFV